MQSLFDHLSDGIAEDNHIGISRQAQSALRSGGQKFYHLSFIEHVEDDGQIAGQIRQRQKAGIERHNQLKLKA